MIAAKDALDRAALILTDLQRDFLDPKGFLGVRGRRPVGDNEVARLLSNCQRLVDAMRSRSRPVVAAFTRFRPDHADSAWAPGWAARVFGAETGFLEEATWGAAPMEGVSLDSSAFIITKKGHGAFTGTHLDRLLANLGVDQCVLAGGPLAASLSDTARMGAALGYRMFLASDAVYPPLSSYPLTTQAKALSTTEVLAALSEAASVTDITGGRALMVIDMQNHFLFGAREDGTERQNPSSAASAIQNVAALADALRHRGYPVIWVKAGRREDRADSALHRIRESFLLAEGRLLYDGTWGAQLADGLYPNPGDLVLTKRGNSAFGFTPLHRILRNLKVSHCVVAGGAVSGCLAATVREATALGYGITVASDAVYPVASPYLPILKDYGSVQPTSTLL